MSVSTVPTALDALVTGLTAALPDVQVVDGQPVSTEGDVICIGFGGVPGEPAVESTRTREQLAREPDREQYDIACLASSWSGDTDAKTVRDRAYELVDAAADVLAADDTLGGVVMEARITTDSLTQEQTAEGAVATVRFIVHADAFTS
ncbi:hypothetical protein [Actinomadura litoris]|uniref:hypothetical protein n=1 Tax=Actinomadura litoris TaxID=2678616 RepID=UPI001FA7D89B|nr:hypothetical protein [Actinomadura litoris]